MYIKKPEFYKVLSNFVFSEELRYLGSFKNPKYMFLFFRRYIKALDDRSKTCSIKASVVCCH